MRNDTLIEDVIEDGIIEDAKRFMRRGNIPIGSEEEQTAI
jgi:hypothetical protein